MIAKLFILTSVAITTGYALSNSEIFSKSVGPCVRDECQSDHTCYYGQCVPQELAKPMVDLNPDNALGPCVLGVLCQKNAFCHNDECYLDSLIPDN